MEDPILHPFIPFTTKSGRVLTSEERAVRRWIKRNPEKRREYTKKYNDSHRDEIRKKQTEKVTCGCGLSLSRNNLPAHRKSQRHKKWQEQQP
jgi:hypothetical protein